MKPLYLLQNTDTKLLFIVGFWLVVFLVNLGPEWQKYSSLREALEVAGLATTLQWLVSLFALKILVPNFLERTKQTSFILYLLLLGFLAAEVYILVSYLYLEPSYPTTYGAFYLKHLSEFSLLERLGYSGLIKYIVLAKMPMLLFPAAILIAANFYEKQKHLLELQEQKQAAELIALKSQLNPHFIFNTLNNIYTLAITGSDRTAKAIEKLSGILDYVLYRCQDSYVPVTDEIEMINNYIALEELRFGDRVDVQFSSTITQPAEIAPLLYLSLVENAFKHGVSQQLKKTTISIELTCDKDQITFKIQNTKPAHVSVKDSTASIGIKNLKKQLKLLYPESYQLILFETEEHYTATLKIQNNGVTND